MKRIHHIVALCLYTILTTISYTAKAQVDTSTTQKLLQYILDPLDKNQIPTGFLEEYGCPMLPMATFNGTLTDSNRINMNLWRVLYLQLQTSWCRTTANPLPTIITVNNTIKLNAGDSVPIPIPLLIGQYNSVKSNAFTSNLLSYNSSTKKVSDVPGRPSSPYDARTLFAACPNKTQTIKGSETFIVPSGLIWNNTGKTISQLQIDFANGEGFRSVSIGAPVTVSYSDTGYKRWKIKATLNDNSVLQCYSGYYVLKAGSIGARFAGNQSIIPSWGIVSAVAGVHSGARIWVNYSNKNRTNTLRKPLIVVEGYDVSRIAPGLQENYSVSDFINGINEPQGYDFNTQLDDIAGYDLVFVDFIDGADGIIRNAAVVQEVINRVNANKVLDARFGNIRQQNVVMGLSMGGLCARYALANMTKSSVATETRLLITHDSPHRGANIPLGLQYMIRMLGNVQLFGYSVTDVFAQYNDAIGLLNAPATQDLLLYRSTGPTTFAANTFLDGAYRTMVTFGPTGPQPTYRFVATANGNECANQRFSPGKTFINLGAGVRAGINARFLFFTVPIVEYKLAAEMEAYALPATGSTAKIARVYTINNLKLFGFINIFKQLTNLTANAPGTHLAVDGVPGSSSPLLDAEALSQLASFPTFAASLYVQFPLGPFLGGYFGVYAYNQGVAFQFTFVPVGSALDINPYNTTTFSQKFVNGVNQGYPSAAATYIAQENNTNPDITNNIHLRFTPRNARWLYNELENLNNTENCSAACFNPFYITGAASFCSGSIVISIPYLQRGATITWNATPSGIVSFTPNGNSATVTAIGNGLVTIGATLTGSCANAVVTPVSIHVGTPSNASLSIGNVTDNQMVCPNRPIALGIVYLSTPYRCGLVAGGITNAQWEAQLPSGTATINYNAGAAACEASNNNAGVTITFPNTGSTYTANIRARAQNTCGWSNWFPAPMLRLQVQAFNCGGGGGNLRVAPNPASSTLNLESTTSTSPITEVRIYDKLGVLRKQQKFVAGTSKVSIYIGNLPADIYQVRAFNGKEWNTISVSKQ